MGRLNLLTGSFDQNGARRGVGSGNRTSHPNSLFPYTQVKSDEPPDWSAIHCVVSPVDVALAVQKKDEKTSQTSQK